MFADGCAKVPAQRRRSQGAASLNWLRLSSIPPPVHLASSPYPSLTPRPTPQTAFCPSAWILPPKRSCITTTTSSTQVRFRLLLLQATTVATTTTATYCRPSVPVLTCQTSPTSPHQPTQLFSRFPPPPPTPQPIASREPTSTSRASTSHRPKKTKTNTTTDTTTITNGRPLVVATNLRQRLQAACKLPQLYIFSREEPPPPPTTHTFQPDPQYTTSLCRRPPRPPRPP